MKVLHLMWMTTKTCLSSVQLLSPVWLFATTWIAAYQASLSITNSWSLLKLMLVESVTLSNHFILCCLFFLLPSIFPSIKVFSNESALCIRWPKYWSVSFSSSPSNEYSELTSFQIDWCDLLVVQGTLKCLLQHSSKASIWAQFFFYYPVLTSLHDYWKKPYLWPYRPLWTKWCLSLFNTLSRFVT